MSKAYISGSQMKTLCLLCCLVYFVSYLTRLNYAVCMVEIQGSLQIGKNVAGLPVTASFLSYGVGQIICGFLGDKYKPQKMIFTGLAGSVLCNLLAVFLPRMEVMIPAWFVNGFFQSMLWPPLVRIMAENLDEDWYRKGCVWVSLSSSGSTVVLYLLAPLCIRISGWKTVFYLAAAAGAVAALIWIRSIGRMFGGNAIKTRCDKTEPRRPGTERPGTERPGTERPGTERPGTERPGTERPGTERSETERSEIERSETERSEIEGTEPEGTGKTAGGQGRAAKEGVSAAKGVQRKGSAVFAGVPIVIILLSIVLHGTLKDGITTWMPVYMTEMFGMSSSKSILSTAVLPVCSVFSTLLSSALLYRLKNEVLTASLLFGTGAVAGISMLAVYDSHPAVCVVMMMLITGCMYGVNLMLISRVPGHFAGRGNVSAVSGILNAATYVGSALSTYVFGAVAESAGWMMVVALWGAAALGGTLLLLSGIRKWAAFGSKPHTVPAGGRE